MSENTKITEQEITALGNPAKPEGQAGGDMLMRMADSHKEVTAWGFGFANLKNEDVILDVGCGSGMAIKRATEDLPELMAYGIDYSEVSVELSRVNNESGIRTGRVDIKKASVDDLPFDDEVFTNIFTVESFYFWPDHVAGLKEILRCLKPGGRFFLIADIYDTPELTERERENIKKYNLFNPTKEKFDELMRKAGFEKIVIHTKLGTNWICVEGEK